MEIENGEDTYSVERQQHDKSMHKEAQNNLTIEGKHT
jgi:hypothetical protein